MVNNARIADLIRESHSRGDPGRDRRGPVLRDADRSTQALIEPRCRRRGRPRDRGERRHEPARLRGRARPGAQAAGRGGHGSRPTAPSPRSGARAAEPGEAPMPAARRAKRRTDEARSLRSGCRARARRGYGERRRRFGCFPSVSPATPRSCRAPRCRTTPGSDQHPDADARAPPARRGVAELRPAAGALAGRDGSRSTACRGRCSLRSTRSSRTSAATWARARPARSAGCSSCRRTWERWGVDANGDGVADPVERRGRDRCGRALPRRRAAGRRTSRAAVFSYNHAQWYVDEVLQLAQLVRQRRVDATFKLDRLQVSLDETLAGRRRGEPAAARGAARSAGAREAAKPLAGQRRRRTASVQAARAPEDRDARRRSRARPRFGRPASRQAPAGGRRAHAGTHPGAERDDRALPPAPLFASPVTTRLRPYVFPVGGGPSVVSVSHHHHDYPAADIAAPEGSPLYALADSVVAQSWAQPDPYCGIGLTLTRERRPGMDVLPPFVPRPAGRRRSCPQRRSARWSRREYRRRDRSASPSPARPADALPAAGALVPAVRGHAPSGGRMRRLRSPARPRAAAPRSSPRFRVKIQVRPA